MAWVAVDKSGDEWIYAEKPKKYEDSVCWCSYSNENYSYIHVPKGTIEKIIGRKLTFEDEPVELK